MHPGIRRLAVSGIEAVMDRLPWGGREAMLAACIRRFGAHEVAGRVLPLMNVSEIGVMGHLGVIRSAWNDRAVLRIYAERTAGGSEGSEEAIVSAVLGFFGAEAGTYVDVGANIGITTIPIARLPAVRCIAFEPEPGNFRFLQMNVAANAPGAAVEFHQQAVSDRVAMLELSLADGNLGDHRLTVGGHCGRHTIAVSAVPLDSVLGRVAGRLAVKVDTQGAEAFVVAGGREMLARAGLLAMEFCPYLMRQIGGDPAVVIDAVGAFSRVAVFDPDSTEAVVFVAPAEAQRKLEAKAAGTGADSEYYDIIALR